MIEDLLNFLLSVVLLLVLMFAGLPVSIVFMPDAVWMLTYLMFNNHMLRRLSLFVA